MQEITTSDDLFHVVGVLLNLDIKTTQLGLGNKTSWFGLCWILNMFCYASHASYITYVA